MLLRVQISANYCHSEGKFAEEPAWKLDVKTTGLAIKQKVCSLRRHWEGGVQEYPSTNPKALWS